MDCLFCKIQSGEIPSTVVYEDEKVFAFMDISPVAKHHILIIPREHIENINDINEDNANIMSNLFLAAKKVAIQKNITKDGYRIIINNGKAAGQEVQHLHLHILGGEESLGPMLHLPK